MDEEMIKALAREYAEELHASTSEPFKDDVICEEVENAESFLRFLLRRFCLVEKKDVRKQFEYAERLLGTRDYNKQCIGVGSKGVLQRLFPEIAKEVSHE